MEAIRGHKSPWMALMSWELHYCFERLKNIHQVRFYLIKHCGLHWVTTWPQMNQPNNIPFWGPQGIKKCTCSQKLKNLHQVRFYLIKHGLHWVTTWPQMNQPYNIPFWGPQDIYYPLLKAKLRKQTILNMKSSFFPQNRGH